MIRKILLALLLVVFFMGNNSYSDEITLGYVDFSPYEFQKDGKPQGILVEIVEKICKRANISLKLVFLPFKRAYNKTKRGEIDGLFNFYKVKERLEFFDYTEPIIENPLVFFVRKESELKFTTLNDLKGQKIGVMRGYTYGADFDNSTLFYKDVADSHEGNIKKLMFERIDMYPCDKLVGIYVARKIGMISELKILSNPLKIMYGHIGFTKNTHQDIIQKINIVIQEMKKNGDIDQIINQYLITKDTLKQKD